jgi:hypothetical protein
MLITLSTNKRIIFLLSQLISETGICEKIVQIKEDEENKDALNYHYKRWINIAGSHYHLHDTHTDKFSIIFNEKDYIVKKDHKPIFYNLTGISYQVVELIHELIRIYNKEWLQYDDMLYSKLANLIMDEYKNKVFKYKI